MALQPQMSGPDQALSIVIDSCAIGPAGQTRPSPFAMADVPGHMSTKMVFLDDVLPHSSLPTSIGRGESLKGRAGDTLVVRRRLTGGSQPPGMRELNALGRRPVLIIMPHLAPNNGYCLRVVSKLGVTSPRGHPPAMWHRDIGSSWRKSSVGNCGYCVLLSMAPWKSWEAFQQGLYYGRDRYVVPGQLALRPGESLLIWSLFQLAASCPSPLLKSSSL